MRYADPAAQKRIDELEATLEKVKALTGGPFSDGYRPYAVIVGDQAIFAVGLEDLRKALDAPR